MTEVAKLTFSSSIPFLQFALILPPPFRFGYFVFSSPRDLSPPDAAQFRDVVMCLVVYTHPSLSVRTSCHSSVLVPAPFGDIMRVV